MDSSHYETLQVVPTASAEAIQGSFDALMAQTRLYPDHPATPGRITALQTAFAVLSDPGLRAAYDAQRAGGAGRPIGVGRIPTRAEMKAAEKQNAHDAARHAFAAEEWAGFWSRFAASFIDGMILWIPSVLVFALMMGLATAAHSTHPLAFAAIGYVLLFILYHGLMNASSGMGTLGRRALGVAVVSADTGERITVGQGCLRALVSFFCLLTVLPELIQLVSSRRRSPADLIAGSVVVRKQRNGGAGLGVLIAVVVIFGGIGLMGMFAAIAIPAYQDYTIRARWLPAMNDARDLSRLVEKRYQETGNIETSPETLGFRSAAVNPFYQLKISERGFVYATGKMPATATSLGIVGWMPSTTASGGIQWTCMTRDVADRYLPRECRGSLLPAQTLP